MNSDTLTIKRPLTVKIAGIIRDSIEVKNIIYEDVSIHIELNKIVDVIVKSFQNGYKVMFCGNGGSAADAQHLAAEFSGRFYKDRDPLPAEALHVNTSYLTAVANDCSYSEVYARIVKGNGKKGDVLIGLSTSGNSGNNIAAFEQAKNMGIITVGLTGVSGGKMKEFSDYFLPVPSSDTPRIQEAHIMLGHIICQLVEEIIYPTQ